MEVYSSDFDVELKDDLSPLTLADKQAHNSIVEELAHFGIQILSEEGSSIAYTERSGLQQLWIVDPLDGTKEFVKKNGEFTVNIALIESQIPVLGVIYQPTENLLFFGCEGKGSYRLRNCGSGFSLPDTLSEFLALCTRLPDTPPHSDLRVACSRSHLNTETSRYVSKLKKGQKEVSFVQAGSSLKFCLVAEGSADVYPRFGPTMEWDTAAGQAIAVNAGGQVINPDTGQSLVYNRKDLLNGSFLVKGPGLSSGMEF